MAVNRSRRVLLAVALAGVLAQPLAAFAAQAADLTVFAASSLKDALDQVSRAWQAKTGKQATISYAASSTLAKQIEQGAPADVFISADRDWMDYLAERNLIKPATRLDLLGNRLVLIAPKDSGLSVKIEPNFPLASLLGDGRLAIANVDSVPAGKYGKAALTKLGIWDAVSLKLAQAENVRAALLLVSRGEAPLGIVYETDAKADPKVKILDAFPENTHPPIIYPVAVVARAQGPAAEEFVTFLKSAEAKAIFEAQGFSVLGSP
jgi:molybdate transport system substrate-binding protein